MGWRMIKCKGGMVLHAQHDVLWVVVIGNTQIRRKLLLVVDGVVVVVAIR